MYRINKLVEVHHRSRWKGDISQTSVSVWLGMQPAAMQWRPAQPAYTLTAMTTHLQMTSAAAA